MQDNCQIICQISSGAFDITQRNVESNPPIVVFVFVEKFQE